MATSWPSSKPYTIFLFAASNRHEHQTRSAADWFLLLGLYEAKFSAGICRDGGKPWQPPLSVITGHGFSPGGWEHAPWRGHQRVRPPHGQEGGGSHTTVASTGSTTISAQMRPLTPSKEGLQKEPRVVLGFFEISSQGHPYNNPGSGFCKSRIRSSCPAFRSFHNRWRDTALEESRAHIRLHSLLALFSEILYVILSLFVFICQSGLLLGKCGVGCLFPTIKAASLKLIVFDLQRSLSEVTQESPCWLLFFRQ